jgi:hypothetical protein
MGKADSNELKLSYTVALRLLKSVVVVCLTKHSSTLTEKVSNFFRM